MGKRCSVPSISWKDGLISTRNGDGCSSAAKPKQRPASCCIGGEELPPYLAWIPYAVKPGTISGRSPSEVVRGQRNSALRDTWVSAHAEDTDPRHKKPAVGAMILEAGRVGARACTFYASSGRAGGRVRAGRASRIWRRWKFVGSRDAKVLFRFWPWPAIRATERREYHALVVLLAGEFYERDHGKPPPSDKALVGPYLRYHLPG